MGQRLDVMLIDRDNDGCYDYIVGWLNGDYIFDGLLTVTTGGQVTPDQWTIPETNTQVSDAAWGVSMGADTVRIVLTDTTDDDTVAVVRNSGASPYVFMWQSYFPQPPIVAGIQETNQSFKVYPNPAENYLRISIKDYSHTGVITLIDQAGQVFILNAFVKIGPYEIQVSLPENLSNGSYFLSIEAGDQVQSYPLTINK